MRCDVGHQCIGAHAHSLMGMRRQISLTRAGQPMIIEMVPGALFFRPSGQGEHVHFTTGRWQHATFMFSIAPCLHKATLSPHRFLCRARAAAREAGTCRAACLASTIQQTNMNNTTQCRFWLCLRALCASLVGPVVFFVSFGNLVAEQWLIKLFYVFVRIFTQERRYKLKTFVCHYAQIAEIVLDNS